MPGTSSPLLHSTREVSIIVSPCNKNLDIFFLFLCVCVFSTTFIYSFFADIQILMGSLVYLRHGIENSPYRSLLETNQWAEICNIFTRDACALLGLSVESPLSVRLGKT